MEFDQQIDFKTTRLILDVLPVGLCILNGERKIQWVNKRAAQWFQKKNISYYNEICCYKVVFKQKKLAAIARY